MMNLKSQYAGTPGYIQLVTPQNSPARELDFGMLRLEAGQRYQGDSEQHEIGLVILTGRSNVFDQRATGVYLPCRSPFAITAGSGGVEIAFCRCLSQTQHPVQLIRP